MYVLELHDFNDSAAEAIAAYRSREVPRLVSLSGDDLFHCRRAIEINSGRPAINVDADHLPDDLFDNCVLIINRLRMPAYTIAKSVAVRDLHYVFAEQTAFVLGLLAGTGCPILNFNALLPRVSGHRSQTEWRMLAARSGLVVRSDTAVDSPMELTYVFNHFTSRADGPLSTHSQTLARLSGLNLLLLGTQPIDDDQHLFVFADPVPSLLDAPPTILEAIAKYIDCL